MHLMSQVALYLLLERTLLFHVFAYSDGEPRAACVMIPVQYQNLPPRSGCRQRPEGPVEREGGKTLCKVYMMRDRGASVPTSRKKNGKRRRVSRSPAGGLCENRVA